MRKYEVPVLAGRHVRLEPLGFEHAGALLAAANEARATYGLTYVPSSETGMEAYIVAALAEREDGRSLPFVVRDRVGAVVGSTRFMEIEHWQWLGVPPPAPLPEGPDAVEIGFTWYAERVQRTAVNTEAKLLLCTHAFERWKVRPGSDGQVRSTAFFSMLAGEWPEARRGLIERLERGR